MKCEEQLRENNVISFTSCERFEKDTSRKWYASDETDTLTVDGFLNRCDVRVPDELKE